MNKGVKIILAIAIAIIYPLFAFLVSITVFPNIKTEANLSYPKYPDTRSCDVYQSKYISNSSGVALGKVTKEDCQDKLYSEYDAKKLEYNNQQNSVKQSYAKLVINRSKIILLFVIIGFIFAMLSSKIGTISAGLALANTILLVVTVGYVVARINYVDTVLQVLFVILFIELNTLLIIVDKFYKPTKTLKTVNIKK